MCNGSVVAVASGDRGEDCYLLKVTAKEPEVLVQPFDDCGAKYPAGAEVLKGNVLIRKNRRNSYTYELDRKQAAVYALTVRYTCQEMEQENGLFVLTVQEHEPILGSMEGF